MKATDQQAEVNGATPAARAQQALALLHESGWDARKISAPIKVRGLYMLRIEPAGEPRLSVVLGHNESATLPASLAYSSESELILHWASSRISLGRPTHWSAIPGDSPGLSGDATDRWTIEDIFALVAPDKLLNGEAEEVSVAGKPHESLAIQLGNSLATLRRAVTELGIGQDQDLDRALLRFFHQLLYVRIQEDRSEGLGRRIASIHEACDDDQLVPALDELLARYRGKLDSDLFAPTSLPLETIGAKPLRSLLRSLVVPWQELNLDFSLSRADLAGRLYQQYLKKTPAVEQAGEGRRPRLLPVAVQRDEQERTAAFYTPTSLASLLAADTLGVWLQKNSPRKPQQVHVLDPACGSGSFLVAAFRLIRAALESGGRTLRPSGREAVLRESLFGADIDGKAIEITRLQLLEAAELGHDRLPDLGENLHVGDSLHPPSHDAPEAPADAIPWRQMLDRVGGFDAILMNPPFGAQLRLPRRLNRDERAELRDRFAGVSGWGSDLAFYFVSLAFELKAPHGCAGMIVPRKLLDGKGARPIRRFLREVAPPDRIVDFRGLSLFHGADPYVALLEFRPDRRSLEALDVADSTVDAALALNTILEGGNRVIRRARAKRSAIGELWTPFALRWSELREQIGRACNRLGDAPNLVLHQGTQTGAQKAFTIAEGHWSWNAQGAVEVDGLTVNPRYVPLVAWGRDIVPLLAPKRRERMLLPFEDDGSRTEDAGALALLERLGGFQGRAQPGAIATLRSPKVILRGFGREPSTFADPTGDWITVKGTSGGLVLKPAGVGPEQLNGVAALMCSSLYQWLLRGFGQPRRDETIEILEMNAEELPWPSLGEREWARLGRYAQEASLPMQEGSAAARTLAYRAVRASIDALVFELLEVAPGLRRTVEQELVRYA